MKYYVDGYVLKKSPSPYGGGYTIINEDNRVVETKRYLRPNFTSDESEVLAVLAGLRLAGFGDQISTDSINTIHAIYTRRKNKIFWIKIELLQECYDLVRIKGINLMWERRNYNLAGIYNEQRSKERHLAKNHPFYMEMNTILDPMQNEEFLFGKVIEGPKEDFVTVIPAPDLSAVQIKPIEFVNVEKTRGFSDEDREFWRSCGKEK